MKKTLSIVLTGLLTVALLFGAVGCGTSAKHQEAIDKHSEIADSFNEVATLINNNSDKIDASIVSTYQQMSDLLNQYTTLLESDNELSDEKYDEMIAWFDTVDTWVDSTKSMLEIMISGDFQ